jgi:hypothetical protein
MEIVQAKKLRLSEAGAPKRRCKANLIRPWYSKWMSGRVISITRTKKREEKGRVKANCIKKAAGESVNPGGQRKSPFSP